MPSLLEKESFKTLLLGPPCSRHGNVTTSTLAHSRGDSAMEELEATLARRLRSLHVTSRVWGAATDACCEETTWAEGQGLRRLPQSDQPFTRADCQYLIMMLGHMSANAGQFSVSCLVPELQCQNWTVLCPFIPERLGTLRHKRVRWTLNYGTMLPSSGQSFQNFSRAGNRKDLLEASEGAWLDFWLRLYR